MPRPRGKSRRSATRRWRKVPVGKASRCASSFSARVVFVDNKAGRSRWQDLQRLEELDQRILGAGIESPEGSARRSRLAGVRKHRLTQCRVLAVVAERVLVGDA